MLVLVRLGWVVGAGCCCFGGGSWLFLLRLLGLLLALSRWCLAVPGRGCVFGVGCGVVSVGSWSFWVRGCYSPSWGASRPSLPNGGFCGCRRWSALAVAGVGCRCFGGVLFWSSVGVLGWGLVPVLVLVGCLVLPGLDLLLAVLGWLELGLVSGASRAVLGPFWPGFVVLGCPWWCGVWRFLAFPGSGMLLVLSGASSPLPVDVPVGGVAGPLWAAGAAGVVRGHFWLRVSSASLATTSSATTAKVGRSESGTAISICRAPTPEAGSFLI